MSHLVTDPATHPDAASCDLPERRAGAAPERLLVDVDSEQQAARLRLVAAGLALASGVWLVWVAQPLWLRGVGVVACAFAALWARRNVKQAAAHAAQPEAYLELGEDHLALVDGPSTRSLPLASIAAVELDDDRLVVVLRLHGGEPWLLEPRYRGIGLRELAQRVHRAVQAQREGASR